MTLPGFLADVALRSSLILAAVLILQCALRRASAAERHLVLVLALAVVAAIPAGLLCGIHIAAPETRVLNLPAELINAAEVPPDTAPDKPLVSTAHPFSPPPRHNPAATINTLLAVIVTLGAAAQLLILGAASLSWRKIRRTATQAAVDPAMLARMQAFAAEKIPPPVLVSEDINVPVLAGWLRPAIILPRATADGPAGPLSMVLCHEMAHFRRGDTLLLPFYWLMRTLYWWHPLVWLTLARLRREREIACDDLVLSQRFQATDYAGLIVQTAREFQATPCLQPGLLAMATPSSVTQRVTSILDTRARRKQAARWLTLSGAIAAFCISWPMMATEIQPAEQKLASFKLGTYHPSLSQVEVSFRLVLIDFDTYTQNPKPFDAALATADPAVIGKLPHTYILSTPTYVADNGKPFQFADVKPMTFPVSFNPDDYGRIIPSDFRTQNLGPTFTDTATLQPGAVTLQFKCSLTYFKQWRALPSGGEKPEFGKKVLWTNRTIHNGHALWEVPGANRYLPPNDLSISPFPANWPAGKDTNPKRMFILVSATPVSTENQNTLLVDASTTGAHP